MKDVIILGLLAFCSTTFGQFAPPAGVAGTSAIAKDSSIFVNWANSVVSFSAGPEDISDSTSPTASYGVPANALGVAEGTSVDIVSLGDGGQITLGFEYPIANGNGPDFAVFENSFSDDFLEFGFVEVSTNGVDFVRFPSTSNTQTSIQTNSFGNSEAILVNNLAGKYRQGFGTPFDLAELSDSTNINIDSINYVRIIDVVGSIDPTYATYDAQGDMINDPFPTAFPSGGFDLDAIGVIHQNNPLSADVLSFADINLYPNPAKTHFMVEHKNEAFALTIYNMQGQPILRGQTNSQIDCSELASGQYFVVITEQDETKTMRLVVAD